ncbi:uncharacterized protein [Spinacia oleracea]|uniref:CCHC-type domain-containing protein n=1 Tax=Spinacia oleracea TaxID=3562 RepID=A0ABM3RMU3_SPIOL|nr:uncharacterized protein LOC110789785 [Spinacia oleracea]XP_056696947.1 uncharacterized protein LOC110789785 [Spinacia oleracea]XP_056696948.1 uncharacterized protein LOC110789785 [Spinacia oleracea]XP_056696949.1 uncharacterized protein LOC110789785 [Spinacia oleracea]
MWRIKGSLEVIDIGKQVYLFKFTQTDDYERGLFGGPWFIMDHYLMITPWKPNFRPSVNGFDFMSVWVRIEELPVEYYDKDALYEIAKVIGKPIRVDYATDKVSRGKYARVCVEIDLRKPIITKVWVGGFWQPVVYENITALCFKCGKIGHVLERCDQMDGNELVNGQPTNKPKLGKQDEAQMEVDACEATTSKDDSRVGQTQSDIYRPWTLVQNKRSPRNNYGKQRQTNARINEYKSGFSSKIATTTSLNGVNSRMTRDKQAHQSEGEVNEPVLVAPSHTLLEISATPELIQDGGDKTVHLANSFNHLAKEDDSPSAFYNSDPSFHCVVNQANTSSLSPTNPLSSSSEILLQEATTSPCSNGKPEKHKHHMHADKFQSKSNPVEKQQDLDSKRTQTLSQSSQPADDGGNSASSLPNQATIDVAIVSRAIGDECMQESENAEVRGNGVQECGIVSNGIEKERGDGADRTKTANKVGCTPSTGDETLTINREGTGFQPDKYASPYSGSGAKRNSSSSFAIRNSKSRNGACGSPYGILRHSERGGGSTSSSQHVSKDVRSQESVYVRDSNSNGGSKYDGSRAVLEGLGGVFSSTQCGGDGAS